MTLEGYYLPPIIGVHFTNATTQAVAYYEQAISISKAECFDLSYNLASLYYKLKYLDKAERLVVRSLNAKSGIYPLSNHFEILYLIILDEDTVYFNQQVKLYILSAKVQKARGVTDQAFASFSEARKTQLQ
jgi:hypothetical protein